MYYTINEGHTFGGDNLTKELCAFIIKDCLPEEQVLRFILLYIKINKGPRIDPWGTPLVIT